MNQPKPKSKKVVNTLSVRLPPELYNKVANKALDRGDTLNSVFIELVEAGLNFQEKEQQILQEFITTYVPRQILKELINGPDQITRITT